MTERVDVAEDEEFVEPAAPRGARGAVLIGARIVTGTVGVVIAAAVVAAAGWLPLPTIAITPSATNHCLAIASCGASMAKFATMPCWP